MWYKMIDGVKVYAGETIEHEGMRFYNPTPEQLSMAGYICEVEQEAAIDVLEKAKADKLAEIVAYDASDAVNSFSLNGMSVWLDRETRVGVMHSLRIEKEAGKTESTLWVKGYKLVVNCDLDIGMLSQLEVYALACFDRTEGHKAAVKALQSVEEVNAYDYRSGYPEKLNFKII